MEKLMKLFSKTHKQDHQNSTPDGDGDLILSQAKQIQNQNMNSGHVDKSMVFMDTRCWRYLASHFRILMEQTESEYVLDSYTDRQENFELWQTKKYNLYLNKRLYMQVLKDSNEVDAMEAVFRDMVDPIKTASIRFLLPNCPLWSSMDFICLDGQVHLVSARILYTVVVQHIPDDTLTPSLFKSNHYYHIDNRCQTLASELKEKLIIAMGSKTHKFKLTMSNKGILINGLSVTQQESEIQRATLMTIPMVGINIEDMVSMLNLDKNPGFKKRIVTHDQRVVSTALSRVYYNIVNTPRPSDKPPIEGIFSNVDMNFIEDLDDENFKHTLLMLCYQVIVSNKAENVQLSTEVEKLLSNQDWSTTKQMTNCSSHYVMLAWEHMPSQIYDYIHIIGFEVSNASIANLGYNEMGHQFVNNNILYVSPYNSNRVYAYSSYAKNSFTKGSDWILNGIKFCKFNHKTYNYGACISYTSKNFYEVIKEPNNEWAMLSIPYINPDMLTTAGIPHVTIKKMMLNKQLLNDMLARNLYGQMTYESLIEYGLSLSYIKYYRGSLPVNVKEIDTEMIRCHAYVAFVLQQRNELATNAIINTITGGPLNRVAMAMTSGMVKFFFQQFSINLSDESIYKKIFKNLTGGLNIENKSKSLMSYWTNLEIFASSSDNFILEEHGQRNCRHHQAIECEDDITNNECPCCHYLTGSSQLKGYCSHCCVSANLEMDVDIKPINLTDSRTTIPVIESSISESTSPHKSEEEGIHDYNELISEEPEDTTNVNFMNNNEDNVTDVNEEELNDILEKDKSDFNNFQITTASELEKEHSDMASQVSHKSTLSEAEIEDALSWPSEESIFVDLDELKPWVGVEKIELLKEKKTTMPKHKKFSSLYFLPHGSYSDSNEKFRTLQTVTMPEQSCGKAVLKYYLNLNLSEQWFYDTINTAEPLTMTQLSACFEKFSINHGFIIGENTIFKTVVDSSLYAIVEYEPRDNLTGHWNCAQIEQIKNLDQLFMVPFKIKENYQRVSMDLFKTDFNRTTLDQQIYINKLLCNTIEMTDCIYPNLPKLMGEKYGNSNYNYLRSGNFCIDLNELPVLKDFKLYLQGERTETEFLGYSDFSDNATIESKLSQLLKICLVNLNKVCTDNTKYKSMVTLEVYSNGNQVMANVKGTKLKSGDVIKLTDGTSQILTMITVINNQLILPTKHMNPAAATINVKIPKISVGSIIRKILAIKRVLKKPGLITRSIDLLQNAKGINGIFGSGKTTTICEQVDNFEQANYLVVGKTRGSIEALKLKNNEIKAVSMEYQSFMNVNCDTLIIDEASLIADWELPLLITESTNHLFIYGDRFQIQPGMYDITMGVLSKSNLLTKCGAGVKRINHTYRIGQPLLKQLSLALNEQLESKANHDTTYNIINMDHLDKEKTIEIMRKNDLCLVFYNEHLKQLQNYALEFALHSKIVMLSTVESAQGLEAAKVAVFQQKHKNAEIHEVTQFCISAASRTVEHLTWVNINTSNKSKELWKLLNVEKIGNSFVNNLFKGQQIQAVVTNNGTPVQGLEMPVDTLMDIKNDVIDEEILLKQLDYYASNRRKINTCGFEHIDINILRYMIQERAAKYGAHSTVEKVGNGINITIKAYVITKWVKIDENMLITSNLSQNDHRDLELTIHNVFGDKLIQSMKITDLQLKPLKIIPKNLHNAIRIIAHLTKISEFMGEALSFKYKSENYVINTIKGCSACTGLKIRYNDSLTINIGPDYSMHASRYSDENIEDITLFKDLLDAKPRENVAILDGRVNINNHLYSNLIVSERIHSFVKSGVLKTLNGSALMHADEEKNQAIVLENELEINGKFIGKLDGYSNVDNWPSIYKVAENNLVVKLRAKNLKYRQEVSNLTEQKTSWFNILNSNNQGLMLFTKDIHRKLVATAFFHDMEDFKSYSGYSIISRIRNQLIGADSFSALLKPISWHENQKNSTVTDKLRDKMSKLYFTKLRILDRVFYVPTEVHNYLHDVYKLGHRSAPTFGASQADPNICAADVAVFNMVVNSGENFKYICECPYVSYSCNELYKVTLPWWDSPLSMNQAQAVSTLRTMLLIHLQNNEHNEKEKEVSIDPIDLPLSNAEIKDFMELKECKYYTPDNTINRQPVMIGPSILSLSERDIQNIALMSSELYFWTPNLEYQNVLHLANSRLTIPKPKWFKLDGGHIEIDGVKHTLLAWKSLADVTIYKLQKSHVVYATKQNLRSNKIQINMPVMFINPGEVIENQSILGAVRTTVDVDVINALRKRLLGPSKSFEDLLVHARTLYHSDRYSSITIHRSVLSTAAEAKNCAIIAYLSTYTEQQSLKLFVTQPESNKSITMQTLKDGLTNLFSEMFSSLEMKINDGDFDQKKFISDITDNPYLKDILINFIDELEKIKLISLKPTRQLKTGKTSILNHLAEAYKWFRMPNNDFLIQNQLSDQSRFPTEKSICIWFFGTRGDNDFGEIVANNISYKSLTILSNSDLTKTLEDRFSKYKSVKIFDVGITCDDVFSMWQDSNLGVLKKLKLKEISKLGPFDELLINDFNYIAQYLIKANLLVRFKYIDTSIMHPLGKLAIQAFEQYCKLLPKSVNTPTYKYDHKTIRSISLEYKNLATQSDSIRVSPLTKGVVLNNCIVVYHKFLSEKAYDTLRNLSKIDRIIVVSENKVEGLETVNSVNFNESQNIILLHHCGVGITSLLLENGFRNVALPIAGDQFNNARSLSMRTNCILINNEEEIEQALEEVKITENENLVKYKELEINLEEKHCFNILQHNDYIINTNALQSLIVNARSKLVGRKGFYTTIIDEYRCDEITEVTYMFGMDDNLIWTIGQSTNVYAICKSADYNWQMLNINMWLINVPSTTNPATFSSNEIMNAYYLQEDEIFQMASVGTYECLECDMPVASNFRSLCPSCTLVKGTVNVSEIDDSKLIQTNSAIVDYTCHCGTNTIFETDRVLTLCSCKKLIQRGRYIARDSATETEPDCTIRLTSKAFSTIDVKSTWRATLTQLQPRKMIKRIDTINRVEPLLSYDDFIDVETLKSADKEDILVSSIETYNVTHPNPVCINKVWVNSTNEFMKKLTMGRDWMSEDLHFVASVYLNPVKLSDSQLKFLLYVKEKLKLIPKDAKNVGVYALEPKTIERSFSEFEDYSVYFSSERLSHLEEGRDNVLWIDTKQSLGRINACARLLPYLIGPEKTYYMRGGRFGPAGFAMEEVLHHTKEKDASGTFCTPTCFYMDGAKLTTKPSINNTLEILSILLNYGSIYGVDEGICYLLPRMLLYQSSSGGYSNVAKAMNVDCRLSRWIKSCKHKQMPEISGPKYKTPTCLSERAWWDITGFNKAMKLVNRDFIPRNSNSPSNADENNLITIWSKALNDFNNTTVEINETKDRQRMKSPFLKTKLPSIIEKFNPQEDAYCVKRCVEFMKKQNDLNSRNSIITTNFHRYESVESTFRKIKLENLSCTLKVDRSDNVEFVYIEGSTENFSATLKIDQNQQGHMVVNEPSEDEFAIETIQTKTMDRDTIYKTFAIDNDLDELIVEMESDNIDKLIRTRDSITLSKLEMISNDISQGPDQLYILVNNQNDCASLLYRRKGEVISSEELYGLQFGVKYLLEQKPLVKEVENICTNTIEDHTNIENEITHNLQSGVSEDGKFANTIINATPNEQNLDEVKRAEVIEFLDFKDLGSNVIEDETDQEDCESFKTVASETEKIFPTTEGESMSIAILDYNNIKNFKKRGSLKLMDKQLSEETNNSKEKIKKLWRKVKAHVITVDLLTYLTTHYMDLKGKEYMNDNESDEWKEFQRQCELPPLHYTEMSDEVFCLQFKMRSEIFNSLCSMVEIPKFLEMDEPDQELLKEICRINTLIVFHWSWKEESYEPLSLISIKDAVLIEFTRQDLLELGFIENWNMEDLPIQPSYEFKIIKTKPKRKLSKLQFNSIIYLTTLELNISGYGALPEEPEAMDVGTANPLSWQNVKLGTNKGPDFHFAAEPPTTNWRQSEMQLSQYQLTCLDSLSLLGGKVKRIVNKAPLYPTTEKEYEVDHYILDTSMVQNEFCDIPIKLVPQPKTIYVYEDEHGMLETQIPLPAVDIGLRVRQQPVAIKEFVKLKLTKYPEQAVPAYTKHMLSSTKAVANLFGSKVEYRNYKLAPKDEEEGRRLINYCYGPRCLDKIATFRKQELWYNLDDLLQWLKQRPDRNKITSELIRVIEEGMAMHPMNIVNIHNKIEARLKDVLLNEDALSLAPTNDIHATKIRQIVWQKKGLTSIFAPVFTRAKQRFKDLLAGGKVLYVDGYTPWQLNKKFNTIPWERNIWFYEDDLTAQDKQTDRTSINFEMWWYVNHLGVSPILINLWQEAHNHWMGKNHEVRILEDAMRQTGQATTALGNALTNLISKSRTVERYYHSIKLMTILGDDNLIIMDEEPDLKVSIEEAAIYYNMENKPSKSKTGGGFLRMQAYITKEKTIALGPDIVRLRRRFELTNNNSGTDIKNLENRAENYKHMLGDVNKVFGEEFPMWYDYQELRKSLAHKYTCTEAEIDNNTALLVEMIMENKAEKFSKLMFATLENKQFKT